MEWIDYILTTIIAIISAGVGTLFGYFLENWRHHKELERARVSRILQPLREVESKLLRVRAMYTIYDYPQFYSDLEQTIRIIKNDIIEDGLGWDIVRESKSLMENLLNLMTRYLEAKAIYQWRQEQIKEDDRDSFNRLFDDYRIQLFNNEQMKNLIHQLTDELGKWLREHS